MKAFIIPIMVAHANGEFCLSQSWHIFPWYQKMLNRAGCGIACLQSQHMGGRRRQIHKFEGNLVYIVRSKKAGWELYMRSCLKNFLNIFIYLLVICTSFENCLVHLLIICYFGGKYFWFLSILNICPLRWIQSGNIEWIMKLKINMK